MPFTLHGSVVLVTGANGGLGVEFVQQALAAGAAKVYAAGRNPKPWDDERVVPLRLDVTDPASILAAAALAVDVDLVVNNAGIAKRAPLSEQPMEDIRAIFETDFFGAVAVVQAFAPLLAANGGGAVIDVHSVMSWVGWGGAYSAAKAALWTATNAFRRELAPNGTHVLGLHLSYTRTPMTASLDREMGTADEVVRQAYAGLQAGEWEVLADEESRDVRSKLSGPLEALYPELTQ